jgi:predicted ATP-dependent serine protease
MKRTNCNILRRTGDSRHWWILTTVLGVIVLHSILFVVDGFYVTLHRPYHCSSRPTTKSTTATVVSQRNYQQRRQHFTSDKDAATGTKLYSLKPLVDDIVSSTQKKTIFVGGKGGVGKTTISSALAVELATNQDLKVLVISTDPVRMLYSIQTMKYKTKSIESSRQCVHAVVSHVSVFPPSNSR